MLGTVKDFFSRIHQCVKDSTTIFAGVLSLAVVGAVIILVALLR